MKLGIVGLPNVGKSTLFNAITQAGAECANYPFCTIEPNVGTVAVPDNRLQVLGDLTNIYIRHVATRCLQFHLQRHLYKNLRLCFCQCILLLQNFQALRE